MKINFILPGYPVRPVGGFRVIYEIANELCAKKHEVHITHTNSLKEVYKNKSFLRSLKKELAYLFCKIVAPKIGWMCVDSRIKLHYEKDLTGNEVVDADIVFATAWQTSEYVNKFHETKGKKYYLVMDFDPFFATKEVLVETWSYSMRLVGISQWLCSKINNYTGKQALLIPLGINHNIFSTKKPIIERRHIVLMMYSKANYKDVKTGIKALLLCMQNIKDIKCIMFGPSGQRPADIPEKIEYRGNIPDQQLADLYNSSAIFISSSILEGFAFPPAEAMACGCAVVCTDCGGNRDYIKDKVNALVSQSGDSEMLYSNIKNLLENTEYRIKLAESGKNTISNFTWKKCVSVLENDL